MPTTTPPLPQPEPSREFCAAVRDSGSCCQTECELCGRVYFCTGSGHGDYNEGELEGLKQKAAAEPDKYIAFEWDVIETGYIDGRRVVVDCECHKLRRFEDWIWGHRNIIIDYLTARARNGYEAASKVWKDIQEASKLHRNRGRMLGHIEDAFKEDHAAGTRYEALIKEAETVMEKAVQKL